MLDLFPDRVHFGCQPSVGGGLYPLVNQVKQRAAKVRGARMFGKQKLGQVLTGAFQKKFTHFDTARQGAPLGRSWGHFLSSRDRIVKG